MTVKIEDAKQCLNFQIRSTARVVSRHYDDALRPTGLRVTQFSILTVLYHMGPTSITELANAMSMERSALARNLKPLEREGLISITAGENKRTKKAQLLKSGNQKLKQALPLWDEAQSTIIDKIGNAEIKKFQKTTRDIKGVLKEF